MKKKKPKNAIKILSREPDETQREEALIFKAKFQQSERCAKFRAAWGIPLGGFKMSERKDYPEYVAWHENLVRITNDYYKSEKYRRGVERIRSKKLEFAEGMVTLAELRAFGASVSLVNPMGKYEFDLDAITRHANKPGYWRYFVEQCLLFADREVLSVVRPIPEPAARWNNDAQEYEIIVMNIFADTTTKDFDSPEFTRKLREAQRKLAGYSEKRPRAKPKAERTAKLAELDAKEPGMRDDEKADEIEGEIPLKKEAARRNRFKQTRYRLKGYGASRLS